MNQLANSGVFWIGLITGLAVLYFLPAIIATIRQTEHLAFIYLLSVIPPAWPAALLGALMLPPRHPATRPQPPPQIPQPWIPPASWQAYSADHGSHHPAA